MPNESIRFGEMYEHFTGILPLREMTDADIPAWAGHLLAIYNAENDRYDRIEAKVTTPPPNQRFGSGF